MSLYLCILDGGDDDEEMDGFTVGTYDDFGRFRDAIASRLEDGKPGSRFPTLMLHSDCDGEWSPGECVVLQSELATIAVELARLPPVTFESWQVSVAAEFGVANDSAAASFITVDGERLVDALQRLATEAIRAQRPVSFQ